MQVFCTIITPGYRPFALALLHSLRRFNPGAVLEVLLTEDAGQDPQEGMRIHQLSNLLRMPPALSIQKKYAATQPDHFRWALKPVFLSYLLNQSHTSVIYLDPDISFTGNYDFFTEALAQHSILLTPHWRDRLPQPDEENFIAQYKDGLFNAGFIGVTREALPALQWWAELCHYKIERNAGAGLYDDQRYLDAMPVFFEKTGILRHQGCNLAHWNLNECKRVWVDGHLKINGEFDPVFIHFTPATIREIRHGKDGALKPFLDEYLQNLKQYGASDAQIEKMGVPAGESAWIRIKRKTLLRTRLKRWLLHLAEKI